MADGMIARFQHYKGGVYRLVGFGSNEPDESETVIYVAESDGRMWVRPRSEWTDQVEVDGTIMPRFRQLPAQHMPSSDVMSHPLNLGNRYLNLAVIYLGEAIATIGNVRQRGGAPGPDFQDAQFCIRRASFALRGIPYEPPENESKPADVGDTLTKRISGTMPQG